MNLHAVVFVSYFICVAFYLTANCRPPTLYGYYIFGYKEPVVNGFPSEEWQSSTGNLISPCRYDRYVEIAKRQHSHPSCTIRTSFTSQRRRRTFHPTVRRRKNDLLVLILVELFTLPSINPEKFRRLRDRQLHRQHVRAQREAQPAKLATNIHRLQTRRQKHFRC